MDEKIFDIGQQLINQVKKIFPHKLSIEFRNRKEICSEAFYCCINWKLNNDKNRPYKRSRIIKILIARETLEDYNNSSTQSQKKVQISFYKFIESKYKKFNSDHDKDQNQLLPTEVWLFNNDVT